MIPGSGTMRNSTEYGSPVANARSEPLASSQRSSGCTISRTSSTCLPTLASDTRSSAAQASDPLTMPLARSISQMPKDAASFSQPHPLCTLMQPFEHLLFGGDVHDRAADSLRHLPGQLHVAVVPVPANRPVRKHSSKLVHVGAAVDEGLLPNRLGRGTIVGVDGGVELRAGDLDRLVPQPVDRGGARGERKELADGVPGPCAEARSQLGQPDAFFDGPVPLLSRLCHFAGQFARRRLVRAHPAAQNTANPSSKPDFEKNRHSLLISSSVAFCCANVEDATTHSSAQDLRARHQNRWTSSVNMPAHWENSRTRPNVPRTRLRADFSSRWRSLVDMAWVGLGWLDCLAWQDGRSATLPPVRGRVSHPVHASRHDARVTDRRRVSSGPSTWSIGQTRSRSVTTSAHAFRINSMPCCTSPTLTRSSFRSRSLWTQADPYQTYPSVL